MRDAKQKRKRIKWQQHIGIVFFILIGAACGIFLPDFLISTGFAEADLGAKLFSLALLIVCICVSVFLQIVIHEAGHLIFGSLSGYLLSSFRIGSFMWIKEDGKLRLRRYSLAGTAGQCLMVPPDMVDGSLPVALYNFGGSLSNAIAGLIFLGLYYICREIPILSALLLMMAIVGFAFALINGVPMRLGTVDNDGYNALSLSKNRDALRSFWVQLKINEQISMGVRLKDMPEQWFALPSEEGMRNSMTSVMGVFACNRLMDQHRFNEARELMERFLEADTAIVGLYRSLMVCDCIFCELIGENRRQQLDEMLDKQQRKFMNAMKTFPAVLRTEYAYSLLAEKDSVNAAKITEKFEKCARTYPHPSEIDGERELMSIADC